MLVFAFAMMTQPAWASCSLSVQSVSFGPYDTFSNSNLDSTGNIDVTCLLTTAYSITLSSGSGSYATRLMSSGGNTLGYNLYTDATRSVVWGDGTGGTSVVSGNALLASHTIYGRIPARQNATVGAYTDTITVTVNF